jgi:tRNA(fMet)-specific endonuclease VapC
MTHLVDSDWIIDYLDGKPDAVTLIEQLVPAGVAISMFTYMEIYQGVCRLASPRPVTQVEALLGAIPVLPFSVEVARRAARLREDLKTAKKRVNSRALDVLNAAMALEHNLLLVTRNLADYADIPGLRIYSRDN